MQTTLLVAQIARVLGILGGAAGWQIAGDDYLAIAGLLVTMASQAAIWYVKRQAKKALADLTKEDLDC